MRKPGIVSQMSMIRMISESIEAAEEAGDRPEDASDREAHGHRDDADQKRVAGAVDDARELVAPELVETEGVLRRGPGQQPP